MRLTNIGGRALDGRPGGRPRTRGSALLSGQQAGNHLPAVDDVRRAADRRLIGLIRVDAENAVDRVEQILGLDGEVGYFRRLGVGCAEDASAFNARARQSDRPGFVVMVAAGAVVDLRRASEFAHRDHECGR